MSRDLPIRICRLGEEDELADTIKLDGPATWLLMEELRMQHHLIHGGPNPDLRMPRSPDQISKRPLNLTPALPNPPQLPEPPHENHRHRFPSC